MAFPDEISAFKAYYKTFPESAVLLIDTYDIESGIQNAIKTSHNITGVRIDSGNLLKESHKVRKILDEVGMKKVKIIVSGDLNEYKIKELVEAGAPIDTFGVGTQLVTSEDAPSLGGIYKLVEQEINNQTIYRAKFSENKATYPGKKQVYRIISKEGKFLKDIIGFEKDEIMENHIKLLVPIFKSGELIYKLPTTKQIRDSFLKNIKNFDPGYQRFGNPDKYSVEHSEKLKQLFFNLRQKTFNELVKS
jgi:nicotinate phosphoribosyltransferase